MALRNGAKGALRASVITLTYNRPVALRRCLQSLVAQSLPAKDFEVVVVDVSTKSVEAVLEEFRASLQVVHHVTENRGVAANRNAGATRARGDVIVFLDDDCRASPLWLMSLVTAVEGRPRTLSAAPVVHDAPTTAVALAGQVITEVVHAFFNPPHAEPRFLPGLNFGVPRAAYVALGGCDESYGRLAAEDRDFNDRWRAAGGSLVLCEGAVVQHDHRGTLAGFVRQYINYGRGAWRYHAGRRRRRSGRMSAEIRLHAELPRLLREPLRRLSWRTRVHTLALLGVWQVANAVGFTIQAILDLTHTNRLTEPSRVSAAGHR
jgi:GT2 family glycosyltransferase